MRKKPLPSDEISITYRKENRKTDSENYQERKIAAGNVFWYNQERDAGGFLKWESGPAERNRKIC